MTNAMLETISSYIPDILLKGMMESPGPITKPTAIRFEACVLFADISGFTHLTEQLAELGPEGVEILTGLLNNYFGQLIDIIHEHGGDVFKFAGDALTAVWAVGDSIGSLSQATHLASDCALLIQEKLHNYQTPEGNTFSLKLGLGAGTVFSTHLGGQLRRWEFFLTGKPMEHAGEAEACARPGQVILSPKAWSFIENLSRGNSAGNGFMVLERISPPDEFDFERTQLLDGMETSLSSYIPGAILHRLNAGQEEWLGEIRRLTVIFTSLPEITSDTSLEQGQDLIQTLQKIIYKYEGSVNKISVDEKGVTLVSAFGLPPFSHEDDPARGSLAAMDIADKLQGMNISYSVAVTTGQAFCGVIGNRQRREYTMMGNVMNRAARLMKAAIEFHPESPVLCDISTFESAQTRVEFRGLKPIQLRGILHSVPIFSPIGEKMMAERMRGSLVGREKERLLIGEHLQGLIRGESSTLVIEGEAGIGKSRLVEEIIRQAEVLGLKHYLGVADAIEQNTNYYAWRRIFSEIFNLDINLDSTTITAGILEHVRPLQGIVQRIPLLNPVLPFSIKDTEFTQQITGQLRADNTKTLMTDVLEKSFADHPSVLIIEDAHWMDSASWSLLRSVQTKVRPLFLVIATRPEPDQRHPDNDLIRSHPITEVIQLDTLSAEIIEAMLLQRLGVKRMAPQIIRFIQQKAEGHPFFSEELAYVLRESGLIQITEDAAVLAQGLSSLERVNFPETLNGVITGRIDKLTPQQQFTLKVASVLGRTFAFRSLYEIHPIAEDRPKLNEILATLDRLDITPIDSPEPDLTYIFKHIITQEVAYNMMSFQQRRQLHHKIGDFYEEKYKDDISVHYGLIAHHFEQAEVKEKAIYYLEKAGAQALRNFANDESIQFFKRILNWVEREPDNIGRQDLARWHRLLGAAYQAVGLFSESILHLEKAAGILGFPIPNKKRFLYPKIIIGLLKQARKQSWKRQLVTYTQEKSDNEITSAIVEMVRIYDELAFIYFLADDITKMVFVDIEMLNVSDKISNRQELAKMYVTVGVMAGLVNLPGISKAFFNRALEAAIHLNHTPTLIRVKLGQSLYAIGIGNWETVDEIGEEASRISEEIGDLRQFGEANVILALSHVLKGNLVEGISRYKHLETHAEQINNPTQLVWALNGQAIVLCQRGNFSEARDVCDRALAYAKNNEDHGSKIHILAYSAYANIHLGDMEAAEGDANIALALLDHSLPLVYSMVFSLCWLTKTYLMMWSETKENLFEKRTKKALTHLRSFQQSFPIAKPGFLRSRAEFEIVKGNRKKGVRLLQKSLNKAQEFKMPYEEAMSHHALATYLTGTARRTHALQAASIFKSLGLNQKDQPLS